MTELGQSRLAGASCRSSHVRNAPLATVGAKKAACRTGPITEVIPTHDGLPDSTFHKVGAAISSATRPKGDHRCNGANLLRGS
jgi:hypothetical protein